MERGRLQNVDEERQTFVGSDHFLHTADPSGHGGAGASVDSVEWPTVDGPLGLSEERSVEHARRFFRWGFCLLPFLWAVNCYYFWPVLRNRSTTSFHRIRPYVVGSAIGFVIFTILLSSWVLTFALGGEWLFGPVWNQLVIYNVADKLGLTGWM